MNFSPLYPWQESFQFGHLESITGFYRSRSYIALLLLLLGLELDKYVGIRCGTNKGETFYTKRKQTI